MRLEILMDHESAAALGAVDLATRAGRVEMNLKLEGHHPGPALPWARNDAPWAACLDVPLH